MPRVAELVSYPVKSCAGVSLDACALTSTGLAFDRLFCVVGTNDGTFISQRTHPRLALVRCDVEPREAFTDPSVDECVLTCETNSMPTTLRVEMRLGPDAAVSEPNARLAVTCWEWRGECADAGEEAKRWFTEFLNQDSAGGGREYSLARWIGKGGAPAAAQGDDGLDVDDASTRLTSENYGSERCATTLSDGYPMLLVNRASVDRLRDVVREESPACSVDARRFRGNVVVDDAAPYAEDHWSTVRIADVVDAELCKPCSRCSIPAVDPDTGDSSGGAPLGVFTCFDIAFSHPASDLLSRGVRLFSYASARVPSLVKRAWTLRHGATLLAADAGGGAGVYREGHLLEDVSRDVSVVVSRLL